MVFGVWCLYFICEMDVNSYNVDIFHSICDDDEHINSISLLYEHEQPFRVTYSTNQLCSTRLQCLKPFPLQSCNDAFMHLYTQICIMITFQYLINSIEGAY